MSDCCNPVTPPTCINRCQQLYNACCVVDEQALPCIFEPVVVTASGLVNQYTITVDSIDDLEVGMSASGGGVGTGAVITKVEGLVVTLSVANTATFPGASVGDQVTFNKIDNPQCDINKAINDILCLLKNGGIPCHTWTDATLDDPLMDLTWTTPTTTPPAPGNEAGYSDKLFCKVMLRGGLRTTLGPNEYTAVASQLFVLPVGSRPAVARNFSVNLFVEAQDIQFTALYIPGILTVNTDGRVIISFTRYNPNIPVASNCDPCIQGDDPATIASYFAGAVEDLLVTFFIDGITIETQA